MQVLGLEYMNFIPQFTRYEEVKWAHSRLGLIVKSTNQSSEYNVLIIMSLYNFIIYKLWPVITNNF
jgi:hypothetical protein